ncbi:MAG: phosphoribosyl-ATP diphosphatase [Alphaproteobacteria bacterium]|nr:phosphoribosyl-ATP diphosphatase [Alphaproteobacteria bacterium]
MQDSLYKLFNTIVARRNASPESSYVAKLMSKGIAHIAKKVGEEGVEVSIAATQNDKDATIRESADVLFHLMVLWAAMNITPEDIMKELERREGVSGIEEKNKRAQ